MGFVDLDSAIRFLNSNKTLFNHNYFWGQQLIRRYGISLENVTEVRTAIKIIKTYEAEKNTRKPSIKVVLALKKLFELNETQKWPSLFLSEAYLLGCGIKTDIKFAFYHLKEAVHYYQDNKKIDKTISKKLANTIYQFLNQFITYVSKSTLDFEITPKISFNIYKEMFGTIAKLHALPVQKYDFLQSSATPNLHIPKEILTSFKESKKEFKSNLIREHFLKQRMDYLFKIHLYILELNRLDLELQESLLAYQTKQRINSENNYKLTGKYSKIVTYENSRMTSKEISFFIKNFASNPSLSILPESQADILIPILTLKKDPANIQLQTYVNEQTSKEGLEDFRELLSRINFAIQDILEKKNELKFSLPYISEIQATFIDIMQKLTSISYFTNEYTENLSAYDQKLGRKRPSFRRVPTAGFSTLVYPSASVGFSHTHELFLRSHSQ